MPYRNPVATAKSLATIDRMSGGRLIAGVGVGWSEAEFAALGVPFHERGARTNEYLRLWQACWAPGKVSFAGKFFSFSEMHSTRSRCSSRIRRSGSAVPAMRRCAELRGSPRYGSRPRCLSPGWSSVKPRCTKRATKSGAYRSRRA
jgi:hypothetical protein